MSLITRCPACGTMFNVVADQLKVSQGWVRCGQCANVFDASLHLQSENALQAPPVTEANLVLEPSPSAVDVLSAGYSSYAEEVTAALKAPDEKATLAAVDAAPSLSPSSKAHTSTDAMDDVSSELPPEAADVSFVRDARRQAFWRKPLVRVALNLLALLLTCLLVLQLTLAQHDSLLGFEPRLKPWLAELCARLACDVGPSRRIEALVIDSSSFNKVNETGAYRLGFVIKNTGGTALAMPSLEVTLTDTQDQAVIRRVLTPAQFGMASGLLGASSDFSGALTLQLTPAEAGSATAKRIAGYRLLAFYP